MDLFELVVTNAIYFIAGWGIAKVPWREARRELFFKFNPEHRPDEILTVNDVTVYFYRYASDGFTTLAATVTEGNVELLSSWYKLPAVAGDVVVRHGGAASIVSAASFDRNFKRVFPKEQVG